MDAESTLQMAERHVREGVAQVDRQRQVLGQLQRDGHNAKVAGELLVQFEALLEEHRNHLQRILAGLNRS